MKGSGKTTRTIDEAIQGLFEVGGIIVPITNVSNLQEIMDSMPSYPVYTDPDYNEAGAQRDFLKRLERRIKQEHPNVEYQRVSSVVIFEV